MKKGKKYDQQKDDQVKYDQQNNEDVKVENVEKKQEQIVKKTVKVRFENDVMFGERYVGGVTHELSIKDFQKLAKTSFKYRVV